MSRLPGAAALAVRRFHAPHPRIILYVGVILGLLLLLSLVNGRRPAIDPSWFLFVDSFVLVLSLVIGTIGLAYYRSFHVRSLLFISTGFIGSGIIDAMHVLQVLGQGDLQFGASENWSAVAARLHLAILLLAGWHAADGRVSRVSSNALQYRTVILLVFGLWLLLFGLAQVLPRLPHLNGGMTIYQLAALLTGSLFCGTLGIFLSHGDWQRFRFQHWYVLALIVLAGSELLFIPLARWEAGGVMFTSEVLRLVAYLLVFTALMSSTSTFFGEASTLQLGQRVNEMINRRWLEGGQAGAEEIRAGFQRVNHAGTFELDLVSGQFRGNQAALDLFGADTPVRTMQQFADLLHPDDRWRLADALMRSETDGDLFRQEYRVLLHGEYRWLEAVAGIETLGGKPIRLLGYLDDITGRKQVEFEKDALYRDLEQLVTAVDLHALTVSLDLDGRVTAVNDKFAAFCDIPEDDLIGQPFDDLVELDPRTVHGQSTGREECCWTGQLTLRRAEGELRTAAGSLTEHIGEDGSPDARIFLGFDISDRIRAEAALKEIVEAHRSSNQDLQMFAHIVSHDLQEPLRMVSSFLKLLERRYADELPDEAKEFIQYSVDGAARMRSLLDGLLEYSRVQSKTLRFEATDLAEPLRDALANLSMLIHESGADVDVGPLPVLECDRSQVMQLFQNLVSNAIKFCRDRKPAIRIRSRQIAGRWVVDVEDNGIGIDPAHYERIFQIFQRLHGRDEFPGTGVGLAVCARIMERHGGGIEVESEPGRGSRFSLRF